MLANLKTSTLGFRINIAVALPFLGSLALFGMTMLEKYRAERDMGEVLELAKLAPHISASVHEPQEERSASARNAVSRPCVPFAAQNLS